jgi:hypothetical protein
MDAWNYVIFAGLGVLVIVLGLGIYSLFRGGEFGRTYSNKLMRLRVVVQAVMIVILVGAMIWRANH